MPTDTEADVLLHALGLTRRGVEPYRNRYVTGIQPGPAILRCVERGLMEERLPPAILPSTDRLFVVTERGRAVALEEYARRYPPLTRAKARYRRFLSLSDMMPGLTFREFLLTDGSDHAHD